MSNTKTRKRAVALLAAIFAVGALSASAATLGGISSRNVQSGDVLVATCDTDGVEINYDTQYESASDVFEVATVTVSGIADTCESNNIEIALVDDLGAEYTLSTPADVVPAGPGDVSVAFDTSLDSVDAAGLTQVVVVISS